ncbi:hypothetical protein SAFG77S_03456 [Streptomyces afghaniensis]
MARYRAGRRRRANARARTGRAVRPPAVEQRGVHGGAAWPPRVQRRDRRDEAGPQRFDDEAPGAEPHRNRSTTRPRSRATPQGWSREPRRWSSHAATGSVARMLWGRQPGRQGRAGHRRVEGRGTAGRTGVAGAASSGPAPEGTGPRRTAVLPARHQHPAGVVRGEARPRRSVSRWPGTRGRRRRR